ncbi:MAG: GIY-YIG nuclease family protein [Flavobacteriaceae bacterium]|nr:GIY-YIG nuclease family protein [Flavobacteriaceae bacterium]
MHFIYILHSSSLNKYYVGETPNVEIRLQQHNNHYFKTNFTKNANDWNLKLSYQCSNKQKAVFLEKFIKRMKSKVFIEKVIQYPTILSDILTKKCP